MKRKVGFLLLAGLFLAFWACSDDPAPIVTSVTISPAEAEVPKGGEKQFTVTVTGENNPAQTVTWAVRGGNTAKTSINDGLLTVAADETALTLTVRATSTVDLTKTDWVRVTVKGNGASDLTGAVSVTGIPKVGQTLTANTDSLNGSGTITYQWKRADSADDEGTDIPGATSATYTLTAADEGKYIKVTVIRDGYSNGVTGAAGVPVLPEGAPTPTVTSVTVAPATAEVPKGGKLEFTATVTGEHDPETNVIWTVEGSITPGTSIGTTDGTLTVAAGETAKTLTIRATSALDPAKSGTATVTVTLPALTGTVSVTGTAQVGQTLTVNTTGIDGSGITYQWKRSDTADGDGTDIPGATSSTYTLTAADEGKYIKVTVKHDEYSGGVTGAASGTVLAANAPTPTVSSVMVSPATASVPKGGTKQFTARVIGENNPAQTVNWTVEGGITGTGIAANGTLTVAANETASTLTVKATSTINIEKSATATVTIPALTGSVSITGTPTVGSTLTANTDSLQGSGTSNYQWTRADTSAGEFSEIPGETSKTYLLEAADLGKYIKVTVTRADNIGSVTSAEAVGPVILPSLSGTVTITGNPVAGQTLTANTASLGGTGTIHYQWTSSSSSSGTFTDIPGETSSSYVLVTADKDKFIKVTVTRSGFTGSLTSAALGPVTLPALSGTVSISGNTNIGQILTASTSNLNGSGTISYQWTSSASSSGTFSNIAGATESTYLLVSADKDKYIKVTVTRTDTSSDLTSAAVGAVTLPPLTGTVSVTGIVKVEQTLTANTDNLQGTGALTYQWKRGDAAADAGNNIGGATSSTYVLVAADQGKHIRVTVKRDGYTGDVTSDAAGPVTAADAPLPTVTSVTVSPATATVNKGATRTFTATVSGEHNPAQTVSWTVEGGVTGTTIANGTLTISANETASKLTVRATSTIDTAKSGTAEVTIPPLTGTVSVSGTATVGSTITANTGSLGGSGTISYQWTRGDTASATTVTTIGANSSTYVLTSDDLGKYIKVTVTRADNIDSATSATAIGPVTLPALGGTVTITGNTVAGQTLTANTTGLTGIAGTIHYQWSSSASSTGTFTDISGETSASYVLVNADDGKFIKVTVTRANNSGSVTSAAVGAVTLPALTGTVSISGNTVAGQQLTAGTGGLGGSGAITYQWTRGDSASATTVTNIGTNSSTYTLVTADAGKFIKVTVTRANNSGSVTSAAVGAITLPALSGSVSITGTATVGQQLTANTGSLGGSGTISYQWTRGDSASATTVTNIGTNSSTYTLVADDGGKFIKVTVTRTENSGSVTSAATSAIALPALTGTVSINGTTTVGQQLTANTTSLGGTSGTITYTWERADTASGAYSSISGATTATYTLVAADAGKFIRVIVSRSGFTGSQTSAAVGAIALPALTGSVSISGTATVGQTFTANTGSLNGTGTLSYQWARGDTSNGSFSEISGATSSTYVLATADGGKFIRVTVSRSGFTGSVNSAAVGAIALPALTGSVSITGTATVGQTLTANTNSLGGSGGTIGYQWARGDTSNGSFSEISGATSSTYVLATADGGKFIRVTVTRTGFSGSVSATTSSAITPLLTGSVTISGTAKVGQALSVNTGSLGGSGTISYQWTRSDTASGTYNNTSNGTSATYTLVAADEGKFIRVNVQRQGFSGTVTSKTVGPIQAQSAPDLTSSLSSPTSSATQNNSESPRTGIMKVPNSDNWAVATYNLPTAFKTAKSVTITFSAEVKREGAAGTLQWQLNNSDWPTIGPTGGNAGAEGRIDNAPANTWYTMSGTWTGAGSALTNSNPQLYLNNDKTSGTTFYYIDNFTITVSADYSGTRWTNPDLGETSWQKTAINKGYDVEMWNQDRRGTASMTLGEGGAFECSWQGIENVLFRAGKKYNETQTHSQIGTFTIDFEVPTFNLPGGSGSKNAYISVYGWLSGGSPDDLIEYYIIERFGEFNPKNSTGAIARGSATIDGARYEFYEVPRTNAPSIKGNRNFKQYFSIRDSGSARNSGTISVTQHFNAWASNNLTSMNNAKLYEVSLKVESYSGAPNYLAQGSARVAKNILKVNGVEIK